MYRVLGFPLFLVPQYPAFKTLGVLDNLVAI